ncbi:MAG: carboxypeptidase-like regulatory domain-containing protein [Pirellulales bacterium]
MNVVKSFRHTIVILAALGTLMPQAAFAAPPPGPVSGPNAPQPSLVLDVALDDGGILRGQVVDSQGTLLPRIPVDVRQQRQHIATTLTDSNGRFEFGGLSGGVYQIETAQSYATCRLWSPRTAPPTAQQAAMIVAGGNVVRGQWGQFMRPSRRMVYALVAVTMISAAIAIPIALNNGNSNGS